MNYGKKEFEKLEKNGSVAVLISRGFGAGWSTWADDKYASLVAMDKDIVELVLGSGTEDEMEKLLLKKGIDDMYLGGFDGLEVKWVTEGLHFKINEYDGSESLEVFEDMSIYHQA